MLQIGDFLSIGTREHTAAKLETMDIRFVAELIDYSPVAAGAAMQDDAGCGGVDLVDDGGVYLDAFEVFGNVVFDLHPKKCKLVYKLLIN